MVPITIAGTTVHAVIDTAASAPVVGKSIASKMGIWKRAKRVRVRQADQSKVRGGKYIVNSSFTASIIQNDVMQVDAMQSAASNDVLCSMTFGLDAKVFDIRHRKVILGLS